MITVKRFVERLAQWPGPRQDSLKAFGETLPCESYVYKKTGPKTASQRSFYWEACSVRIATKAEHWHLSRCSMPRDIQSVEELITNVEEKE